MAELKEVFEMVTKQTEPDLDSWKEQEDRQRRSSRNRRMGGFAVAAAIVAIAVVAALVARDHDGEGAPLVDQPDEASQTLSIVDVGSGTEAELKVPRSASWFDVTLDGSMIAYTDLDQNEDLQVFVMDADGSNPRQLTHGTPGVEPMGSPPQWSPDGSTIAYWMSLPEEGVEVFTVRLSDSVATRLTHEPKDVYEGGWATDRSFVFSTSNPSSAYPLVARSIDRVTGETVTIARDVSTPEPSPDGTYVAFDSFFRPEGEAWLSLMNIDGTGRRKLLQAEYAGSYPRWSPDSTQIAFRWSTDEDGSGTYVYDLATGETRFVTDGRVESWIDDQTILVS